MLQQLIKHINNSYIIENLIEHLHYYFSHVLSPKFSGGMTLLLLFYKSSDTVTLVPIQGNGVLYSVGKCNSGIDFYFQTSITGFTFGKPHKY